MWLPISSRVASRVGDSSPNYDALTKPRRAQSVEQRSHPESRSAPAAAPSDVVPNGHIGNGQAYALVRQLSTQLEASLSAMNVKMRPLKFLKRCMKEVERRYASSEILECPKSLKYFTETAWGKDIIAFCADQIKSELHSVSDKEKTDALLAEQAQRRAEPHEIPPEARKLLNELGIGKEAPDV